MSEKKDESLERDPEFVAMSVKGQFIEDLLKAMSELGIENSEQLAEAIGADALWTKRFMCEEETFDIDVLSAISATLGFSLSLRMNERI